MLYDANQLATQKDSKNCSTDPLAFHLDAIKQAMQITHTM